MNTLYLESLGFVAATAVIVVTGTRLSKYRAIMADILGWEKLFAGILLIASVSSMPELMNGISSVLILDTPDLAIGDFVGSYALPVLIFSIMDLIYHRKKPLTSDTQIDHVIAVSFVIILLSLVAIATLMRMSAWIGEFILLLLVLYLIAIRVVILYDKKENNHRKEIKKYYSLTLKQVVIRYSINTIILMVAAMVFKEEKIGYAPSMLL